MAYYKVVSFQRNRRLGKKWNSQFKRFDFNVAPPSRSATAANSPRDFGLGRSKKNLRIAKVCIRNEGTLRVKPMGW